MNLTAIRSVEEAVIRHYAESIFLGTLMDGITVVDIGSGAGFPGFPISVFRPEWQVTLVESDQRKAVFLREAARGLPNISVIAQRAEDLQGSWDWVISRGVRPEDVVKVATGVGRKIGLLGGEKGIPLPWGDRRFALVKNVPRGT